MPEMHATVRWPDGTVMRCYSPSLVLRDYLAVGGSYAIGEFVERSRTALSIASQRVQAKYGAPCVLAARQLAQIEDKARAFAHAPGSRVSVEAFHE